MAKEKIKNPVTTSHLISISSGATVGYILYIAQVRASQYMFRMLRVHSGFPVVSSVLGSLSLTAAFLQSTLSMVHVANLVYSKISQNSNEDKLLNVHHDTLICSSVVNLGIYKQGYRQNFRSVLPSHIVLPGAFSHEYLPLTSVHVTKHKRQILQELGHKYGCHHCGAKVEKYIADHIPPTRYLPEFSKLACSKSWNRSIFLLLFNRDVLSTHIHPQVLFPQCRPCSYKQAGYVSKSKSFFKSLLGKDGIIMHKMRFHHYFVFMFPIYLLIDNVNVTIKFG